MEAVTDLPTFAVHDNDRDGDGIIVEYLTELPDAIPADKVLVHNRVRPVADRPHHGRNGSRFWLSPLLPVHLVCDCGWAPMLGHHFKIDASLRNARP